MKKDILQTTSMSITNPPLTPTKTRSVRENKTVPVQPVRILGIEFHEFIEEDMGYWSHSHRCTWMARIGFPRHIDSQTTDCVDAFPVEFREG
jgi:hypothetical protein